MNEFTDKNEQAFLDACGAIGVETNAMVNAQKDRYLVSEFLKNPVSWLEILYHSYYNAGRGPGGRDGIDRMISDGGTQLANYVSSTKALKRAIGYSVRS
jgi:hypothetical protein